MKKMRKNSWTIPYPLLIVGVLFAVLAPGLAQNVDAASNKHPDTGEENARLKARILELEAELAAKNKALEQSRADLVQTHLELKKLRSDFADLRVNAAIVLANKDDVKAAHLLRQLMIDMSDLNLMHQRLRHLVIAFGNRVETMFAVYKEPADLRLKQQLKGQLAVIIKQLQDAEKLSSLKKATKPASIGRVLAVDQTLNTVILDIGHLDGVKLGMVLVDNENELRLKVIETRPLVSAAVPVKGHLNKLVPGTALKPETVKP